MQKIKTFLGFNDNAEAAVNFYLSVFKAGKILHATHYPKGAPGLEGSELLSDAKTERVMAAVMAMKKLDIAALKKAAPG